MYFTVKFCDCFSTMLQIYCLPAKIFFHVSLTIIAYMKTFVALNAELNIYFITNSFKC